MLSFQNTVSQQCVQLTSRYPCTCQDCLLLLLQPKEEAVDVKLWRKRHAAARVKREFRTADEVLQEAADKPGAVPRQTILDMRGPQVHHQMPNRARLIARISISRDAKPLVSPHCAGRTGVHYISIITQVMKCTGADQLGDVAGAAGDKLGASERGG